MIDVKNYRSQLCPVCKKFRFPELTKEDIEENDYIQCPSCGWKADLFQEQHSDVGHLTNELSIVEYKKQYRKKIKDDADYYYTDYYEPEPHVCPVCGKYTFPRKSSFEYCPQCGWVDDAVMENEPDQWEGCSNILCLRDYRKEYYRYVVDHPNYKFRKDGSLYDFIDLSKYDV